MIYSGTTSETRLQNVCPLAQLAMREAGTDGFVIYAIDSGTGIPEEKYSGGSKVPEADADGFRGFVFPLSVNGRVTGWVAFGFTHEEILPFSQVVLSRMTTAIETVWNLFYRQERYANLAERIGILEAELADSKIADRTRGLLERSSGPSEALTVVQRHVEGVVRGRQASGALEQLVRELEEELADRELAARAKVVLGSVYGMSEEQAHLHLRVASRRSRRRVREIAQEIIEARELESGLEFGLEFGLETGAGSRGRR